GHCVYLARRGGWAKRVEVGLPGRGPVVATDFRSVAGWVERLLGRADYGAVRLPEPVPGPYREVAAEDPDFGRVPVAALGYCSDRPGPLWAQERAVREAQDRLLVYRVPVFGGTSGGPVLPLVGDNPGVVAIQQDGDFAGTTAVRITPPVRANIRAWADEPDLT
ncbi:MAG: hypothetical protein C0501_30715, partial [Isosphaera sp.]|nr:hypothetical protein [Isosphaera sp.]